MWVGEFGAAARNDYWVYMMRFIEEYELDWAYWALNGDRWDEGTGTWRDESYGILLQDYATVRNPQMMADLERLPR